MKINYLIVSIFTSCFLLSCTKTEQKSAKLATNYISVHEVLDTEYITSDTITQNNISFINSSSNKEVSILNHLEKTSFHFFNDIEFKNKDIGILVGGAGLITRITKNGGKTWLENRFSRFGNPFYAAAFLENSIFVVGDSEYIFKTVDYGENWSVFNTKQLFEKRGYFSPKYYKTRFITKQIGFIVGSGYISGEENSFSVILKTVDGGKNWVNIEHKGLSESAEGISDFVAFSEQEIMIVTFSGRCYKSIDGGINWKLLYENKDEFVNLNSIAFLTPGIGLIGGLGGYLLYTKNAGKDWLKIELPKLGKGYKSNISDIVFTNNSALITTAISYSDYRENFVYKIDKDGTNIRPFLTTESEEVLLMGDSYGVEVLNNDVYILDRNNLYKTSIID